MIIIIMAIIVSKLSVGYENVEEKDYKKRFEGNMNITIFYKELDYIFKGM